MRGLFLILCALAASAARAADADLGLRVTPGPELPHFHTDPHPGHLLILESSPDLVSWTETARVRHQLQPYGDWSRSGAAAAFYRVGRRPLQDADDAANQITPSLPDLFRPGSGSGLNAMPVVKWTLLLSQPDRVWFQDSVRYAYHIEFARARLPGYATMSVLEYNAQSLYATPAQLMVLGSVMRAPDPQVRELGLEITGAEAFPAARAAEWADAVRRRLVPDPGWRVFYLPSREQEAETRAGLHHFTERGFAVAGLDRWVTVPTCYSPGWALGRLAPVPAAEIPAALADGRLAFGDILVTDRVPAELPVLAGYLCFEPATPNSHVALLARSLLLPFAHASSAGLQAEIASLYGREVLLVVSETNGACRITLQDTTGLLTPERRQEILDSRRGGPLDITPKARRGALALPADGLDPADLQYVGGKAAHFGLLRRALPDDTPHPAIAFTFDLWDDYLDQPFAGGPTLRAFIAARLARHTYPPEVNALRADLAAVQEAVEDTADFTPGQREAILQALLGAGLQGARIRFRSSTNVEDSDSFSGAGLYDSYSGCLEDDTDSGSGGPSRCDPTELRERGVFRAIRKVYASFYNENAFLERLRHGIREADVGMALLVHFSVPDEQEMANGVATLAIERAGDDRHAAVRIVSQLGAESVTNPDVTVRPEIVTATYTGPDATGAALALDATSSRLPPGATVMRWETDYRTLLDQMNAAARAYEAYYPDRAAFELDFEYKRTVPGHVGLKQMRLVPHPEPVPPPTIP